MGKQKRVFKVLGSSFFGRKVSPLFPSTAVSRFLGAKPVHSIPWVLLPVTRFDLYRLPGERGEGGRCLNSTISLSIIIK